MPGLTGELVVTTLVCFLHCTRGCGCIGARHSPRPLISGRKINAHLGRTAPRECGSVSLCLAVIACDKREAFAQGSPCDEAIHPDAQRKNGLLRGACHRAALRAGPLASNDG